MTEKEFLRAIAASFNFSCLRAKQLNVPSDLTLEQWHEILRQHAYLCHYCQADLWFAPLSLDHKQAISLGGANTASNIVPACKSCNSRKGAGSYSWFKGEINK